MGYIWSPSWFSAQNSWEGGSITGGGAWVITPCSLSSAYPTVKKEKRTTKKLAIWWMERGDVEVEDVDFISRKPKRCAILLREQEAKSSEKASFKSLSYSVELYSIWHEMVLQNSMEALHMMVDLDNWSVSMKSWRSRHQERRQLYVVVTGSRQARGRIERSPIILVQLDCIHVCPTSF